MSYQPLTYFEKLENVYVLMETRQMLQSKLDQLKGSNELTHLIEEDLRKIEEEIKEYTEEEPSNQPQQITSSLFNPEVYEEK